MGMAPLCRPAWYFPSLPPSCLELLCLVQLPQPPGLCWWAGTQVLEPFGVAACRQHHPWQARVTMLLSTAHCPLKTWSHQLQTPHQALGRNLSPGLLSCTCCARVTAELGSSTSPAGSRPGVLNKHSHREKKAARKK